MFSPLKNNSITPIVKLYTGKSKTISRYGSRSDALAVGQLHQVGLGEQVVEQVEARTRVSGHERLALALLPAVAVGGR